MIHRPETELTLEDHEKAFTEVSFLLEVLVNTVRPVVGNAAPAVGTAAGREMAKKLPIYLDAPDFTEVLEALADKLEAGFELAAEVTSEANGDRPRQTAAVTFGRCALRSVCEARGLPLGGELCQMFHYYLAGMAAELLGRPARPTIDATGPERCVVTMRT